MTPSLVRLPIRRLVSCSGGLLSVEPGRLCWKHQTGPGNLQPSMSLPRTLRLTSPIVGQPTTSSLWLGLSVWVLVTFGGGCATTLSLYELHTVERPTTTISYTGVRSETRRFPDYGAIDKSILTSRP